MNYQEGKGVMAKRAHYRVNVVCARRASTHTHTHTYIHTHTHTHTHLHTHTYTDTDTDTDTHTHTHTLRLMHTFLRYLWPQVSRHR